MVANTADIYIEHADAARDLKDAKRMKYYHDFDMTHASENKAQALYKVKALKEHLCKFVDAHAHKSNKPSSPKQYTIYHLRQVAALRAMPSYNSPGIIAYALSAVWLLIINLLLCNLY